MKANELMVGDYIYVKRGYDNHLTLESIKGILQDEKEAYPIKITTGETISLKDIIRIRLTPEILEKNGFKKFNFRGIDGQHEWTWWNNTLTNVSLWCRELNDNTKDGWMIRIESPTSSLCVKVEFLHELQHALKLCGIEKEITL